MTRPTSKSPLRKCAGCNAMKPKSELLRVVRTPEGQFFLDLKGKADGRGAYVCKEEACFKRLLKTKGLERSFKGRVPQELYKELEEVI